MKYIICIIASLAFFSCEKRYELDSLDSFTVSVEKNTYAVGDSIRFVFTGSPDYIVFWSGAAGNNYDNRTRTFVEGNTILLNFKSYTRYGVVDQSNLKLLISTDFSGIYDSANIRSATWEDITNRAILSSGQDQTSSGNIDVSDFASLNKNMAIALRYVTDVIKTSTTQNQWVIRSFDLTSTNANGDQTALFSLSTAGWSSFNFSGPTTSWTVTSSALTTTRNFISLDDDWVVTKQFNPNSVSPDKGVSIKNLAESRSEYTTAYSKPGTYKVVFVATNANVKDQESVVKEVYLTIN